MPIGTVEGAGSNHTIRNYEFTDTDPPSTTTLYYRLKQTDYDGRSKTFSPVAIKECDEGNRCISVYPNPAEYSDIHISVAGMEKKEMDIEIYDTLGKLIFSGEIVPNSNSFKSIIKIEHKPTEGIYVVRVKSTTGIYRTNLVIK